MVVLAPDGVPWWSGAVTPQLPTIFRVIVIPWMAGLFLAGCAVTSPPSQVERLPAPVAPTWGESLGPRGLVVEELAADRREVVGAPVDGSAVEGGGTLATGQVPMVTPGTPVGLPDSLRWATLGGQRTLTAVVTEALQANFDLQASAARLQTSLASLSGSAAPRAPQLGGSAGASRRRSNANFGGPAGVVSQENNQFGVGLDVSWELDVWGRLAATQRADLGAAQASWSDFQAARISLAGRTASAWLAVTAAKSQLALAEETATSFTTTLALIERRFERGTVSSLDVRLARAQTEAALSQVAARRNALQREHRFLAVLMGRYPRSLSDDPQRVAELPELPPQPPTGMPSDLLTRRPDLVAAERRLAAQSERVFAARRAFLPAISLSASAGQSSQELEDLLDSNFSVWTLAANLVQPIFQGGRLRANFARQSALATESLANYGQVALNAFREVETALAAESHLREQVTRTRQAQAESQAAFDLATGQYERGLVDIITVLDTQRRAFADRSSLIEVQRALLDNRLALHLALGGGFTIEETTRDGQNDAGADQRASVETLAAPIPFGEQPLAWPTLQNAPSPVSSTGETQAPSTLGPPDQKWETATAPTGPTGAGAALQPTPWRPPER